MKHLALVLALCASTAIAQSVDLKQVVTPNPVTVVLTAIPWLLKDKEPYYFVQVKGYGRTVEEAKTQGFRTAVDQSVGSVINSEREVTNQRLSRSEVVHYASGFVDQYEIKKVENERGFVAVTMDVWIKRSRLSERLLGDHKTPGKIDGERTQAQAETLTHSRQQGDRLLNTVLADYPRRAFDIELGTSRVYYDEQRAQKLEIKFQVKWRQQYLESLREALSLVSQNPNAGDCVGIHARRCQHQGYVTIKARPGVNGWARTSGFDDSVTLGLIEENLYRSAPAVLLSIYNDKGQRVWHGCRRYAQLDNIVEGYAPSDRMVELTPNGMQINGYFTLDAVAPFNIDSRTPVLDTVKAEVVRNNQCPN